MKVKSQNDNTPANATAANTNTVAKRYKKSLLVGALSPALLALVACQSTPTAPVMQRADATFETTGLGVTKVAAQKEALLSAEQTCGRYQPIILTNDVIYNGVLDERTGRMVDKIGTVAGAVLGKTMPELSREDDYEYTINFRCQ